MSAIEVEVPAVQVEAAPKAEKKPVTNLVQMLIDAGHPMGQVTRDFAKAIQIPEESSLLIGLAGFSTASLLTYRCEPHYGGTPFPLGLYVIAEQPPASSKTAIFEGFHMPTVDAIAAINAEREAAAKEIKTKMKAITKQVKAGLLEKEEAREKYEALQAQLDELPGELAGYVTDATPAAFEAKILVKNNGAGSLAGDEQTLLETIFLCADGQSPNLGLLLKGYEGSNYQSIRISREGYTGRVALSFCLFAQRGSIQKIMEVTRSTGLVERFWLFVEGHMVGHRDFTKARKYSLLPYETAVSRIMKRMGRDASLECARKLCFTQESGDLLRAYRAHMEPLIQDGADYGDDLLKGAAGKCEFSAMKLAANLHLLAHYAESDEDCPGVIHPKWVELAIRFDRERLSRLRNLLLELGVIGKPAQWDRIISYLESKPGRRMLKPRFVHHFRRFAEYQKSSVIVRAVCTEMVERGWLVETDTHYILP
ncbi:DUF3987 domain-containing protein [Salmonella enterica]|nr:DUF3987 domain-containing protein [Salmonella enterica]